jgi:nicotinate dehydrogenase subunit B
VTGEANPTSVSRRSVLAIGGILVSFALSGRAIGQKAAATESGGPPVIAPDLKGSLRSSPYLDAWIRLDRRGLVTVFTGKAELGQGIRTALIQVAAEELDISSKQVELITADTLRTPNEGLTAGSHSMQDSGGAIQNAAANVRMLLTRAAAKTWRVAESEITTTGDGRLRAPDGHTSLYGDLAAALSLHVEAVPEAPLRDPRHFRLIGKDMERVDIPPKVTGGVAFIQDLRLPGMLHARVIRGPSEGTRLGRQDLGAVRATPGVLAVVQEGTFLAVVAEEEWTAIRALRRLERAPFSRASAPLQTGDLNLLLKAMPAEDILVQDTKAATDAPVRSVSARYSRPFLSHGSIGPSCAIALFKDDLMTVWSHSQGVFSVQAFVADLLGLPLKQVHVIHSENAGCYGQNGADDAAADAAMVARAIPGRPIRLQWMREQEFGWEPLGVAMVTELQASLDTQNRIVRWRHEIWSNRHNTRPEKAGGVWAGGEVQPPFSPQKGKPLPMPEGDGDRNSNPLYDLPNTHVVFHYIPDMPVRVSALRSLGAHLNVFSIESMFDELARAAGVDPLALRLNHMKDERARNVMVTAAGRFGWAKRAPGNGRQGRGMSFARYKNLGAYCAVMMEVEVERESGRIKVPRVVAAVDTGQAVNPNGVANQVEGGIIQSISWTSREAATFDAVKRTSFDWSTYPIVRFADVPGEIDVLVVDRPGSPFLGTAEAAQGPAAAALANAFADATGVRLRELPLSPERVLAAIGGA